MVKKLKAPFLSVLCDLNCFVCFLYGKTIKFLSTATLDCDGHGFIEYT